MKPMPLSDHIGQCTSWKIIFGKKQHPTESIIAMMVWVLFNSYFAA